MKLFHLSTWLGLSWLNSRNNKPKPTKIGGPHCFLHISILIVVAVGDRFLVYLNVALPVQGAPRGRDPVIRILMGNSKGSKLTSGLCFDMGSHCFRFFPRFCLCFSRLASWLSLAFYILSTTSNTTRVTTPPLLCGAMLSEPKLGGYCPTSLELLPARTRHMFSQK